MLGFTVAALPTISEPLRAKARKVRLVHRRRCLLGPRISLPGRERIPFARQPASYRDSVLPKGVKRLSIEAASPESWYRWVGSEGVVMGLDRFGASAPYERIYEELGLTVEKIVASVRGLVAP